MNAVFLDTVGLLALWDKADQWHAAAEAAFRQVQGRRSSVVTTTFILLECGNNAARRVYRPDVCDLRRLLEQRQEVVTPTTQDWAEAWQAYERGDAGRDRRSRFLFRHAPLGPDAGVYQRPPLSSGRVPNAVLKTPA